MRSWWILCHKGAAAFIAFSSFSFAATSCSQVINLTPHRQVAFISEPAYAADSFVDSVGVATHVSYIDTAYAAWPKVLAELKVLGVRHIRDSLPTIDMFVARHTDLAAAGIGCTCIVDLNPAFTADVIARYALLAKDVESLEAPNECDAGANCGGGGSQGVANVVAYLPRIYLAGQKLHVPVLGPSFTTMESYAKTGPVASNINYSNLHVYFGGRNPGSLGWGGHDPQDHAYGSIAYWIDQGNLDAPGLPAQITETGYLAYPHPSENEKIPEAVEAAYIPRTLLLAYKLGIKRTFVYEFLDESVDTGYGLLRSNFTPKPAFLETRTLLSMLNDPGKAFAASSLKLSLEGGGKSLEHLLFEKRDGSFYLVLWLEQSSYDASINKSHPVEIQNVRLNLDTAKLSTITTFNEEGVESVKPVTSSGRSTSLGINDQLTILRILPH